MEETFPQHIVNIAINMYGLAGYCPRDLIEINKRYHNNTLRIDEDGDYCTLEKIKEIEEAERTG